jgi:hypothetical protein
MLLGHLHAELWLRAVRHGRRSPSTPEPARVAEAVARLACDTSW